MKKLMGLVLAVFVLATLAVSASSVTVSVTVTNGQATTFSEQIPAGGILEAIELYQTANCTTDVKIATYSGTTPITTYAGCTLTTPRVIRLMVAPTDTNGVALAAATGSTATNYATTVLSIPYLQPAVGGNLRMAVTEADNATCTVTATLYFTKPMSW